MFHIFSLVCFLIYGVKRRQILIAKPHLYFFMKILHLVYFINNFIISSKSNNFLNKFGPIWAHKGPYGPQPGPGPNPYWAPTRPGQ